MGDDDGADTLEEWLERQRGIMTKNQRRQLLGPPDEDDPPTPAALRQLRLRVRRQLYHSLLDFPGLVTMFEEGGFGQVFDGALTDTSLTHALVGLFEFLYMGLGAADPHPAMPYRAFVKRGTEHGLIHAAALRGTAVRPDVSIEIDVADDRPLADVREAFEADGDLETWELDALYWSHEITHEEWIDAREDDPRESR